MIKFISVLDKLPEPDHSVRHLALTEEGYLFFLPYTEDDAHAKVWFDREHDCGAVIAWAESGEFRLAATKQFSALYHRYCEAQPND